ncbi:MAG: FtsX-like permease family protein [Acidimicrobiales bacterium]
MTPRLLRLGLTGWRRHPAGTALSFLLLLVGATAVMLAVQLRAVALDPWQRTFDATNGAHLQAFGATPDVARVADLPGVTEAADPLPHVITSLVAGDRTFALRAFGADQPPAVERPLLTAGRWVGGGAEVALDVAYARSLGLGVGDRVTLRGVDGARPFTVVGLWVLARDEQYPANRPGEGFVGRADLERLQPDSGRWRWSESVRFARPDESDIAARAAFSRLPPGVAVQTWSGRLGDAQETQRATTIVLEVYGVVLLAAVALVLASLVGTRVLERAGELGLLKAVGFTPAQVVAVVLAEHVALAAMAAVAGSAVGVWLTPRLLADSSVLLGAAPTPLSPARVAATAAVVMATAAAAAMAPALRVGRSTVARSLRARGHDARPNRLSRRVPLERPLPVTLGVKQTLGRPGRSALTAAALTLSVGSLVAGLAFEATVRHEDALELADQARQQADARAGELAPTAPDPVPVSDATREQLKPIVHGFNGVLAAVAVINLAATALVSLRRRQRELAVTRAVGLTPRQVRLGVYWADGLLGVVAAVAGIPLGTALFLGVYQLVNGSTERAALPPWWQLALVPVVTVAAVVAVIAGPARAASRLGITTALRQE